ncbi:hypothetical protein BASA81_005637 [Batrachochytrium salamandrivorans]|nr:hypothetical protein BASA81_005637 [Batrachochytrium salamandrivorans]
MNQDIKQVVFIRHGHSLGQQAPKHLRKVDVGLVDCTLSETGKAQAFALSKAINPELFSSPNHSSLAIFTSPLTRALYTTSILFRENLNSPVVVLPGLAEVNSNPRRGIPENTGRKLEDLLQDWNVSELLNHPLVDLTLVADSPWPAASPICSSKPHGREKQVFDFILARPEPRIIIVAHCNIIFDLLHAGGGAAGVPAYVENCVPIHCTIRSKPKLHLTLEPQHHEWFTN